MTDDTEKEDGESLVIKFERALDKNEQITLTYKLQTLLLQTYERRLMACTISDTGLAALQRLLATNGWSLDPATMPSGLRDKLTSYVDPNELDNEGVLPFPTRKQA